MTQTDLGKAIGMAQTWVSKLEDPDYGKMTVSTLLRLAEAFDTDLEIKFRPFSRTLDSLSTQGPGYFSVPNFDEEFGADKEDREAVTARAGRLRQFPTADGNISRARVARQLPVRRANRSSCGQPSTAFDHPIPKQNPESVADDRRQ
jgi:transcriptional regulator with XRE-family HTH domain